MADKQKIAAPCRRRSSLAGIAISVVALGAVHLGFSPENVRLPRAAVITADTSLSPEVTPADTVLAAAGVLDDGELEEIDPAVEGRASYYGSELAGRRTASGEPFDPGGMTAAHPSLPFGTRLRVTNIRNGRSVVVRINDRGPFGHGRAIDLSYGAARAIGMVRRGTARVTMEVVK